MSTRLAALLLVLVGCGGEASPREAPLQMLVADPAGFDGQRVATQGVVRHFEAPLHYWIEDEALNRVELFPPAMAAPLLGQEVRVVGTFRYAPASGRSLSLETISPLAAD